MGSKASSRLSSATFRQVTRRESEKLSGSWGHCVHGMIHAPLPNVQLFNWISVKHAVMMQMRFDGRLGFPGGRVDDDDISLETALLREVREEMGELPEGFQFTTDDHVSCTLFEEKKTCLHFYCKQVTFEDYLTIERMGDPVDFEVLGAVRVPLFIMRDWRGGLPAFLRNNFIGNSREQLLDALERKQLVNREFLDECVKLSRLPDPMSSLNDTPSEENT